MAIDPSWWNLPREERLRILRDRYGLSDHHPTAEGNGWRWLVRRTWGACWKLWLWDEWGQTYGKVIRVHNWNTAIVDWGGKRATITPQPFYRQFAMVTNLSPLYVPPLCVFIAWLSFLCTVGFVKTRPLIAVGYAICTITAVLVYNKVRDCDWIAHLRKLRSY
jgi:hypothetical protein